jgi:adenine-specific DNA-methyltransferase
MANNCRIFTPTEYVNELLDAIGYKGQLYGKSILENSGRSSSQIYCIM